MCHASVSFAASGSGKRGGRVASVVGGRAGSPPCPVFTKGTSLGSSRLQIRRRTRSLVTYSKATGRRGSGIAETARTDHRPLASVAPWVRPDGRFVPAFLQDEREGIQLAWCRVKFFSPSCDNCRWRRAAHQSLLSGGGAGAQSSTGKSVNCAIKAHKISRRVRIDRSPTSFFAARSRLPRASAGTGMIPCIIRMRPTARASQTFLVVPSTARPAFLSAASCHASRSSAVPAALTRGQSLPPAASFL